MGIRTWRSGPWGPGLQGRSPGGLLRIAVGLLAAVPLASGQEREAWNKWRVLLALDSLAVAPERECSVQPVASAAWRGQQEAIAELHGGLLSPYDGIVFPNFHYVQIEHIVSRAEADQSGMCARGIQVRTAFAADVLNLTLAPGSLNASKGDRDAHDIEVAGQSVFRDSLTPHARCWWVAQSIRVKDKYGLSVDAAERSAMRSIINGCTDAQVYRPTLPAGSDWMLRSEFLGALTGQRQIGLCADPVTDLAQLRLTAAIVSPYLPNMACVPYVLPSDRPPVEGPQTGGTTPGGTTTGTGGGQPVENPTAGTDPPPPPPNPRASQIEAQRACIGTLEAQGLNKNCTNIRRSCPSVAPIRTGEPLYGYLRDTDRDGVVCESLPAARP